MRSVAALSLVLVGLGCGSAAKSDPDAGDGSPQMGACSEPEDCDEGMICIGNACVPANCEDFELNGNETDVDCGGDCGPCTEGQQCVVPFDCVSQFCNGDNSCQDCSTTADCAGASGTFCAGGICVLSKQLGATCTNSDQCGSANCVDGVCCDGPCDGECESCNSSGTCTAIPAGTDPDEECTDPASEGLCGSTGFCNGAGQCGTVADTTACSIAGCATGASAVGECADGFCETTVPPTCGNYACVDDVCLTQCSAATVQGDADCADNYYCVDGESCIKKKDNGSSCDEARECKTGKCVDGVCCNSLCNGTCESCVAPDNGLTVDGTCGNIPAGQGTECTDEGAASCGNNGKCDGAGACQNYPDDTPCASASCSNSKEYAARDCSGGSCPLDTGTPCSPYKCDGNACDTDCPSNNSTGDSECQSSYWCDGNSCEVKKNDGDSCTRDRQCKNGQCIDSVCCGLLDGSQCPELTHWCPNSNGSCVVRGCQFVTGTAKVCDPPPLP